MLKKFIVMEFSNWHIAEWLWMLFCSVVTIGISWHLQDTLFGMSAALTGVLYSLWAGKGKLSCYFFGIYNSIAYGVMSFQATLYGEVLLNFFWYLPMMFAGLFFWRKHLKPESQEIIKRCLDWRGRLITAACAVLGTAAGAMLLRLLGDRQPGLDSFTTVLSIIAMVLTVKRCAEQWLLWTLVNIASIWMWYQVYLTGEGSAAVLLMWILALINGIIFFFMWKREIRQCPQKD